MKIKKTDEVILRKFDTGHSADTFCRLWKRFSFRQQLINFAKMGDKSDLRLL